MILLSSVAWVVSDIPAVPGSPAWVDSLSGAIAGIIGIFRKSPP
jgi:hypothetical protein